MRLSKVNIAFFIVGLCVFSYLVYRFGIDQIVSNIERAGWSLVYVVLVWLVIYVLNAAAWTLVLGANGKAIAFRRLFMVTVSGFVINYITPVVAIGGEPYKVKALSGAMGAQQSLSAVVLYRMIHLLGHMMLLLTGILAAVLFLPLPMPLDPVLVLIGGAILWLVIVTLSGHREGVFQRLSKWLAKFRVLRRLSEKLQRYEDSLPEMDTIITGVYQREPWKFTGALLLEYTSRLLMGVEVYLILGGIGIETTLASALFLYVAYSIVINVLFFVPMNLGAREGGLVLGLQSLALPPLLGVYLGIVMRIREFVWILIGLLFILLTTDKVKSASGEIA
jgi:uncharacterized protein (TIRG00374 family)